MTSTTTLQEIKPADLKPNRGNPPGRTDDLAELVASILAQGILEPLVVAPAPGTGKFPGKFDVVFGHRRLAAAKMARLKTVPCVVREDLTDPAAQLEAMLVENLQRVDLTPIEEAKAYQQLLEFPDYTIKRITTSTGRAAATVRRRLGLTKLSDKTQGKIQCGQINLHDALALAEFADDAAALVKLEAAVSTSNWAWALQNARDRRIRQRREARIIGELRKSGVRIVDEKLLDELDATGRAAGTPGNGWVYVDPAGDIDDLRQTVEEHAACDGHAAIVQHGEKAFVCTEPARHPELLQEDSETPGDRDARKATQAERERIEAELATAATVRRAHLAEQVTRPDADLVKTILVDDLVDRCRRGFKVKEVLADVLMPKRANDTALLEQLRDKIRTFNVDQVVICLDIAKHAAEEATLDSANGWGPDQYGNTHSSRSTEAWRTRLADVYGYEYSQAELDRIPPPRIIDVPLPEHDVTPEEAAERTERAS